MRTRDGDVVLLARHFLQRLRPPAREHLDFSAESLALLQNYSWPGNIRELRNAVERGIAMARGETIEPADLPNAVRQSAPPVSGVSAVSSAASGTLAERVDETERAYLENLLKQHDGNVAASARQAGISRQGFHKLLKKHNVHAREYRP